MAFSTLLSAALLSTIAVGQTSPARLTASDARPGDRFGASVSVDSDRVAVGAPHAGVVGEGAVYVYHHRGGTWTEEAILQAGDASAGAEFGHDVSIQGDLIAVGAPGAGTGRGAAYVFRHVGSDWIEENRTTGENGLDRFGASIDLDAGLLVVGAPRHNGVDFESGAVYLYRRRDNFWNEVDKLEPLTDAAFLHLGEDVSLSKATLFVRSQRSGSEGALHVYKDGDAGWTEVFSHDPTCCRRSIAVVGDYGLAADRNAGTGRGAVASIRYDGVGWYVGEILGILSTEAGDFFGASVAYDGELALIGAPGTDDGRGAAHLFGRIGSSWVWIDRLGAVSGSPEDSLGVATAIDGLWAAAGAPGNDEAAESSGAVHLFPLTPPVSAEPDVTPEGFHLDDNWPEPVRTKTSITYTVLGPTHVDLELYDLLGRRVAGLDSGMRSGRQSVVLDVESLAPGVYVYRLLSDSVFRSATLVVAP